MHIIGVGADAADDMAHMHGACFDEAWNAETFVRLISPSSSFALIAQLPGQADGTPTSAGFALLRVVGQESELLTLGVIPPWRSRGIGAGLMARALDSAAVAGASAMMLEVAEDNRAGRRLYDRFGFVAVGRRKAYYRRDNGAADAITMTCRLSS